MLHRAMIKRNIAVGALAIVVLLAIAFGYLARNRGAHPAGATPSEIPAPATPAPLETEPATESEQGFLYGRVTAVDGTTYEGRLRWGIAQEAFWDDAFNGVKSENPWIAQVRPERMPKERRSFEIFGFKLGTREREIDARRPFLARFGDLARLEAHADKVRVTLKGGAVVDVNRFDASDFDDGLRVWDRTRGVVDLDSLRIRSVELLRTVSLGGAAPLRLHGTVRTRSGDFTGFIAWDRQACVGTDELAGRTAEGEELGLRFDTIRSIARRTGASALVTLGDGREIALYGTDDAGLGNRGIHVEDPRFGRVLIAWGAFERVDFTPTGSGPAYDDFPPGAPLEGSVTTRDGRRLGGRLVYDLDESSTLETLDASVAGLDYSIPFARIASIALTGSNELASVTLHGGEELQLEQTGDLGEKNAGLLIFVDGREPPEYVPWAEVERIDFERSP